MSAPSKIEVKLNDIHKVIEKKNIRTSDSEYFGKKVSRNLHLNGQT